MLLTKGELERYYTFSVSEKRDHNRYFDVYILKHKNWFGINKKITFERSVSPTNDKSYVSVSRCADSGQLYNQLMLHFHPDEKHYDMAMVRNFWHQIHDSLSKKDAFGVTREIADVEYFIDFNYRHDEKILSFKDQIKILTSENEQLKAKAKDISC